MLIELLITIWSFMISVFLSILNPILQSLDLIIPYDISSTLGQVLGNIYSFNSFLPITETYVLVSLAITFKLAIFSYKVIWVIIDFTKYVSSYVRGVRM